MRVGEGGGRGAQGPAAERQSDSQLIDVRAQASTRMEALSWSTMMWHPVAACLPLPRRVRTTASQTLMALSHSSNCC